MKAILAANQREVAEFILKIRQDIMIVAQAESINHCLEAVRIHKPDLVITSDALEGGETWDQVRSFLYSLKESNPIREVLCLFTQKELTSQQILELIARDIMFLNKPISEMSLSAVLKNLLETPITHTEPAVIAMWSPKPGDGSSLVTEAASYVLYDSKEREDKQIGVLDLNLQRPYLKYRYHLDESNILDDLLPYIKSGALNQEILQICAPSAGKRKDLKFVGGIARPELFRRYGQLHLNSLIETARKAFSRTIIDAGGDLYNLGTVAALRNADMILAIIQPDYTSKICLRHSLDLLPSAGINPNKVKVVVNRFLEQRSEEPAVIMSGISAELLGTLADIGADANHLGDSSLFSPAGNKLAASFLADLKNILEPADSSVSKREERKGRFYKMITRGVG